MADIAELARIVDDAARNAKAIKQLSAKAPLSVEESYAVQSASIQRRVARGEWRDYAIDHDGQAAVFSVFRHSYDSPLFSVSKSNSGKDNSYTVFYGRQKIKQDPSLMNVLKVFDRLPRLISTH